jgi:hypothetical protein
MTTMKRLSMLALPVLLSVFGCGERPDAKSAGGSNACPEAVTQSVIRELPGATIRSCKAEKEEGHDQFEVKLEQGGLKIEVDVTPDGRVLQTETIIALTEVPANVMAAFSAKYPGAKSTRAEKQVRTGKGTFYEIKFDAQPKAKEATFSEDGAFVGEE